VGIDSDYKGNGVLNPKFSGKLAGGGNPMILIRNRQRPIKTDNTSINEKNVGGYVLEDINNDGSSIHMTSGLTISEFQPICLKKMWG
ncbi:hypothetical protein U2087_15620, partial [Listeria monocytogenes]|uniref:hypothetical protein n=1 Tax=Listeria monocytogenes TaxID=1639 RepID=UPI002FDBAE53